MVEISWEEFKEYKKYSVVDDKFLILLDFMKSFYNLTNPIELFEIFQDDPLAEIMLKKRDIKTPEELESFMFSLL